MALGVVTMNPAPRRMDPAIRPPTAPGPENSRPIEIRSVRRPMKLRGKQQANRDQERQDTDETGGETASMTKVATAS